MERQAIAADAVSSRLFADVDSLTERGTMSDYIEFLKELFHEFGAVTARKMFGGHGIFYDGLMIGLVADGTLYLKADDMTATRFKEHGLAQFQYQKNDRLVGMSYYQAPEEAMEDPLVMRNWAQLAFEAALRARK
jgi:DNA transformation protein